MKAGFIGLGTLGKTMAARLESEGVELVVWNRTPAKAEGLKAAVAATPADVASEADFTFLNLFDSAAVESVLHCGGGLLSADLSGKVIIDTTTNHFVPVVQFHGDVAGKGGSYLEAPVLGSVVPASKGALTVVVSGGKDAYDRALPLIQKIGSSIFYLGEPGLATKMKLVNNLALGSIMATIAESVVLGEAIGLERAKVLEILAAGGGNSLVLNAKREKLTKGDFTVHFSSAAIYKDLHCLQDLARELNRPLFTGAVVKELYGMARARGEDALDFSAVYKILKNP